MIPRSSQVAAHAAASSEDKYGHGGRTEGRAQSHGFFFLWLLFLLFNVLLFPLVHIFTQEIREYLSLKNCHASLLCKDLFIYLFLFGEGGKGECTCLYV